MPYGDRAEHFGRQVEIENPMANFQRAVRFNELQRRLEKITTKTLTQQLRELEEQKIIQRTVYPDNPPKVEYALTELGESIYPVLKSLCDWGTNYQAAVPPTSN